LKYYNFSGEIIYVLIIQIIYKYKNLNETGVLFSYILDLTNQGMNESYKLKTNCPT